MRITFQTQETEKQDNLRNIQQSKAGQREKAGKQSGASRAYGAAFFAGQEDNWLQGASGIQGNRAKAKSLVELQQEAGNIDAGVRQDYMTVMANTMSETDFSKLEEEGFDFGSLDPEEAVNIVDKIKAELARSGQHIVGYTDDLDMATLAEALGSDTLARAVSDSFASADVPMTQENLTEVKRAWDMASQLEEPGDGVTHYMIDNQAEPEIWDFYLAQSSGAETMTGAAPRYYAEDIQGYYAQSADGGNGAGSMVNAAESSQNPAMQEQIDKIIASAGLEVAEARENANWLMEQGLPITAENLLRMQELQQVSFPVTEETFAKAAASAILDGKSPVYANLADTRNVYEKAAVLTERFMKKAAALLDSGDVAARRQLEEIRLRMTAEVNVKLLKSGFSIDTAPMEELLEALKQVENELARSYFPQDAQALEKYELYRQTSQTVAELPGLPVQVVGSWSVREATGIRSAEVSAQAQGADGLSDDGTLAQFHSEGKALQETYDKAQESYEALMTAPRKDMGDSIRKAFANVDAILEDLGYTASEENRRAVRILGYNRMEMTVDNVERVKQTDEQVRSVISQMTPAATLKMIRDGVNPLESSFEELENYFASQTQDYEESAESYSHFLYHLEQTKEITPAEREAYVGIYRLIRQIEKSDGAAVGAVVNTGAELQFANLLSAVRSGKFRHMDVKVTDETGLMQELVKGGKSISGQINDSLAAMAKEIVTEVSSDEEIEAQYRKMELEQIRQAAEAEPDSFALLTRSGLAANADNLVAAQALLKDFANPYKKLREKAAQLEAGKDAETVNSMKPLRSMEDILSVEDMLLQKDESDFVSGYQDALNEMKVAVEQTTLEGADTSVDVKELQLIHKQLTVMTAMSDSKEYILPMYIGEELGRVHLTLVKDAQQKGTVTIQMDWAENAHVEAHLQVSGEKITGYLVGNTEEEVTKLTKAADIFHELLKEDASANWEQSELPVVSRTASMHHAAPAEQGGTADTTELYQVARMFLRAIKE